MMRRVLDSFYLTRFISPSHVSKRRPYPTTEMIMTRLKFTFAAIALGICGAPALAADIHDQASMKDPIVPMAAVRTWTGFYLGAGGGGLGINYFGGVDGDILVAPGDPPDIAPFGVFTDADKIGYFGTAQL